MTATGVQSGRSSSLPIPPALGCLLSVLLGLAGVGILFVVLSFAFRGEVRFSAGELTETRVWLIREEPDLGLGVSTARIVSGSRSDGQACVETTVRFLMLRSSEDTRQSVAYCECLERVDDSWIGIGACDH